MAARWLEEFFAPASRECRRKAAVGAIGPEGKKQLQITAQFAAAGVVLVTAIVVGYFGGRALDRWLETEPYCGYAGLIFGVIAGFRNLFQLARAASKMRDAPTHETADTPSETPSHDEDSSR